MKERIHLDGHTILWLDIIVAADPSKEELRKIQEFEKFIASAESEMSRLKHSSKILKGKADELQRKMENAGGEKLQQQKALVEKLQGNINAKNTEINRRKVQITTGSKAVQKLKKALDDAAKESDWAGKKKTRKHRISKR